MSAPTAETSSPWKRYVTPFNVVAAAIIAVGIPVTVVRFTMGLGACTNLTDNNPWGLWIGFDVLVGVALAAGGYVTSCAVYVFGMKKYHPIVRPAVLTGFLGYVLVAVGLLFDIGRSWRLPYPFIMSQGWTSVMFEVAACVALYLTVLFLEFLPVPLEWLRFRKLRNFLVALTIPLTIAGVILSTLHQSSLGALFVIAPGKLHPLWYSPYLAVFFFVSSIVAGLSMVIFESGLSHRVFRDKLDPDHPVDHDGLTLGLAKASALVLFAYFGMKIIGLAHGNHWRLLNTGYGYWFLAEAIGFVLLPCILFTSAVRRRNATLARFAAALAVIGIIVNRLNVSIIAFNWQLPPEERYFPHWMEFAVTITLVTIGVLAFIWIVEHMPVLREHPEYKGAH
ncbi:MAG: Ni/Fe-hydrogenase cytochrome b subunit [Phycisphaerae bacterium]|nr:Ni/Fe-hydrogenase cytochrome b subunit [Phycisphaerae bacterium]